MIDLFILMVIVIGLSLAVYHIAQYSTKETSFEQAIQEQRQKREFETVSSKNVKKPQKKIKVKKQKKSKKEESDFSNQNSSERAKKITIDTVPKKSIKIEQPVKVSPPSQPTSHDSNVTSKSPIVNKNMLKKEDKNVSSLVGSHPAKKIIIETAPKTTVAIEESGKKVLSPPHCKIATPNLKVKKEKSKKDGDQSNPAKKIVVRTAQKTIIEETKLDSYISNVTSDSLNKKKKNKKSITEEPVLAVMKHKGKSPLETKALNLQLSTVNAPIVAQSAIANDSPGAINNKLPKGRTDTQTIKPAKASSQVNVNSTIDGNKTVAIKKIVASPLKQRKHEIIHHSSSTLIQEQKQLIQCEMQPVYEIKKKPKTEVKRAKITDDVVAHVLPIIKKSNLNSAEIQMMIEVLLNKQQLTGQTAGDWVEKGRVDPNQVVKRQLMETKEKLKEQMEAQEALSAKISELRSDLNGERSRSSTLRKQLDGAGTLLQQKLDMVTAEHKDALNSKMKEMKRTLEKEFQGQLLRVKQSCQSESNCKTKQLELNLQDVEKQLQQTRITVNQSEQTQQQLQGAVVDAQQHLEQAVLNRDELMQRCQQYQLHINALKEQTTQQDVSFNARIAEMQQCLSASEDLKSQINLEREQLQQQLQNHEGVRELFSQSQVKLKETIREKCELESMLSSSGKELVSYGEVVSNQKLQIERLIEEKDSLAVQCIRPAVEGRENGDFHTEEKEPIDICINAEYEEKLSNLTKDISRLKDDLSLQRRKNEEEKDKYDRDIRNTTHVLLRIFPSIEVAENLEQVLKQVETGAQTAELKSQIVEKIVEKIVQDPALAKQIEELKNENDDLHKQVEKLTTKVLEANRIIGSSADESTTRIQQLEIENKSLEDRITHYQRVLSDTESLLKTLQSSVESEEAGWKDKFVHKEELICQLNADKANLALRVAELQAALDKVKEEEMDSSNLTSSQMEYSNLTSLKEKLESTQKEKGDLEEKLHKAQEMLRSVAHSQEINANGPSNGVEENHEGKN